MATSHRRRRAGFIAVGPKLLAPAVDRLQRRLASEPENTEILGRLAETQRMLGQLEAARATYRRLLALAPDPMVAWLVDVLGTAPLPTPPTGQRAVPFARVTDFLSAADFSWLLSATLAEPQCFVPAKIGNYRTEPTYRLSLVAEPPLRRRIRLWFVPKFQAALPTMLARLASENRDLRADRLADYEFETNITVHRAGGLYQGHKDTGEDRRRYRRISFVFYFGQQPRRFQGGDLLLHDTNYEGEDEGVGYGAYTRVAPSPNSLVIFPSDSAHEVTRVASPTGAPLDLPDCRFTVNGWIYADRQSRDPSAAA